MQAKFSIARETGLIKVKASGYVDGPGIQVLMQKMEAAFAVGPFTAIIFDFSDVIVINSVAISALLSIWDNLEVGAAPDFHFCGAKPLVFHALEIAGFPLFARFWDSEAEARAQIKL